MDKINDLYRQPSVIIKDQGGNVLATYGDFFVKPVQLEALPSYVKYSVLAVEDRRFYNHWGIDLFGIFRAFIINKKAGRVIQGGSSITQQLAKNILISMGRFKYDDQSYRRKLQEVFIAFQLERKFSKDQIFSMYLNRAYFGSGAFGIEAASKQYFQKSANKLTVFEAALIAGLLKAPSKYSPHANAKKSVERAKTVLNLMVEAKFIKNKQPYLNEGIKELEKTIRPDKGFRYFTDWVYDLVPLHIDNKEQFDLEVTTTFDSKMQKAAEYACKKHLEEQGISLNIKEVAFVAMTPSGAVKAMVGGRNYGFSQFNRVVQALRQAGSAIKPFIYLAALESGEFSMEDYISDELFKGGSWEPSNFHWKARGMITLDEALVNSVNSVTLRLAQAVGVSAVQRVLKSCGIYTKMPDDLTIALGTGEVTLLDLTAAFSSFSNGGYLTNPYGIVSIKSSTGKVLYKRKKFSDVPFISEFSYNSLRKTLNGVVVRGTGRRARIGNTVSGKTGSNGNKDAWFIGYREHGDLNEGFTDIVVGTWVGNDNNEDMKKASVGGRLPAMIVRSFLLDEVSKRRFNG